MAEVVPFRGVLFNLPKLAPETGDDLLAPPYDIITPEYREELYRKSPHNIVRIDFGRELAGDGPSENRYTRSKSMLDQWRADEVLIRNPDPCFYCYEVEYEIHGRRQKLRGFLGLVRLEELGKGSVYPHEFTHSKPKKDRLDLMRYCEGNVSPIYSLYNSPARKASAFLDEVCGAAPYLEGRDQDGAVHRLWIIPDRAMIDAIRQELADKAVFIADGHHRYETALEYQREAQEKSGDAGTRASDYVLMFLANMADEGITVLPTHRMVKTMPADAIDLLSHDFRIEKMDLRTDIASAIAGRRDVYGLYAGGDEWHRLTYTGEGISGVPQELKDLDVTVLHDLIFKQILDIESVAYEMSVDACISAVREGRQAAAFFLNPTGVKDVERVALASLRMPPKSTYFYPKLMTGMVLNIFNHSL